MSNFNTSESVTLVIKAQFESRESSDFVSNIARAAVASGAALPEELSDLFSLTIITRPSGSKYGVIDFA